MDRPPFYTGSIWRSFDVGQGFRDCMKAVGRAIQFLLGNNGTYVSGLTASAQSVPNMSISVALGQIGIWSVVDSTTHGSLAADTTPVYQQGYVDAQTLNLNVSQLSAGQQQWALVQAGFQQLDVIRTGDPTGGVEPFWNSTNPPVPLQGPDGLGGTLPTVRKGYTNLQVIYGTPATAGSAVPPSASSGFVGLYLILLSFTTTQITNGMIQIAGNAAYSGYPEAPFVAGLLASHHNGKSGQAPKIQLANGAEVQGVMAYANLPVTNQSPPAVGGNITASPGIPIVTYGTVNPASNVAGNVGDEFVNTTTGGLFLCTVTGSSSTATWIQVGLAGTAVYKNSFPFTVIGGFTYQCDTPSNGAGTTLSAASTYGGAPVVLVNIGTGELSVTPGTGEAIGDLATNAVYVMQPGDILRITPRMGGSGANWLFS